MTVMVATTDSDNNVGRRRLPYFLCIFQMLLDNVNASSNVELQIVSCKRKNHSVESSENTFSLLLLFLKHKNGCKTGRKLLLALLVAVQHNFSLHADTALYKISLWEQYFLVLLQLRKEWIIWHIFGWITPRFCAASSSHCKPIYTTALPKYWILLFFLQWTLCQLTHIAIWSAKTFSNHQNN